MKNRCACCGYLTMNSKTPGSYEICPVCYWEDDPVQYDDPNYYGGANIVSLSKARENYIRMGAISEEYIGSVRKPFVEEI